MTIINSNIINIMIYYCYSQFTMKILIVVESPSKINKISSFLGKDYQIEASYGHFRDLDSKTLSVNLEDNFDPMYVITKPQVVSKLRAAFKSADELYIASDLDYEGSAIGQSLLDVLKPKKYKRLIFNAITKKAILESIENAGKLNKNQVNAQKARRVLDRLFGYLISPVLANQLGGKLSAGRVQSPTVRLIVEKEEEINKFMKTNSSSSFFRVNGGFSGLKAALHDKSGLAHIPLNDEKDCNRLVISFLNKCLKSEFTITSVSTKKSTRNPSPPFTTPTLQQEASLKFGMSIDATMQAAQKLYEAGYITYMRTDSVYISDEGHKGIKEEIIKLFGEEYYKHSVYSNQGSSQEAHEAIRPTNPTLRSINIQCSSQEKLYKLIWNRTIASQMKPAILDILTIKIDISKVEDYFFQSQTETVVFPGFTKIYSESKMDEDEVEIDHSTPPSFKKGDDVLMEYISAKQDFLKHTPRYSEASLVKKLKSLDIGRPATYVNTIKTVIDRGYVCIKNNPGVKKDITTFSIKSENNKHVMQIFEESSTVVIGAETKKIVPTELGLKVNKYMMETFPEFMEYKFTANMENDLDEIANGNRLWTDVVKTFYLNLKSILDKIPGRSNGNDKLIGNDENGNSIYLTVTRNGPCLKKQLGSKAIFANFVGRSEPSLEDALKAFEYPKVIGQYKGGEIKLCKGKFGLYIQYNNNNYSVKDENISLSESINTIESYKEKVIATYIINKKRAIVLKGNTGVYIQVISKSGRKNFPVSKDIDPSKITLEVASEIISKKRTYTRKQGKK